MSIQDQPVEDGSTDATDDEKRAGIVEQTKQDVSVGHISEADYDRVLAQRLADAGLEAEDGS
ncbi:hypothetical protein [Antiquaquibacter soli]|uniref:DUF3072 domain-containing protein n=1 Tax=Antiquaquibacter soli TaxID=3064523 RepID=A0ABT9BND2_9MICO|nr:hypothetical protein [Protaetiibacter sp. WY-16]MDO7880797.1 hypothetical protein [Protaetiibacter sp. WY-16]